MLMVCAAWVAVSCSDTKSYTDMLNDEEDAIDRLIAQEGIEVLKHFPEDSVFAENLFVKLDDDILLNIIDKGSDERAVLYETKILYRCNMRYFLNVDTLWYETYGPHSNGTIPFPIGTNGTSEPFIYGAYSSNNMNDPSYYYVSEGMQVALQYVGDRGKVKMIVPFRVGTYMDQSSGDPVYYETLEFIFDKNL